METSYRPGNTIAVRVIGQDPITVAGVNGILRDDHRIVVAPDDAPFDVVLLATADVTSSDIGRLRELRSPWRPTVLLASEVGERHLLTLIECGVTTIVDRATTTAAALGEALVAAAGDRAMIPSELLGRLLGLVRTMQHETLPALGLNSAGLTDREVTVLRLLADGAETAEIAQRLTYSESTIKHVLHELTIRFKFRNRVHAVASAFRAGVL